MLHQKLLERCKGFPKTKDKEYENIFFNENIFLSCKANLDIQIILEPYGCVSYIVGYISKSQRCMSAQLDAAAKEARKGNLDLKKQVRHIGNIFSNCGEVSAQEAVYLYRQIHLTKCTREIVFINTSIPEERIFLLKPKATLYPKGNKFPEKVKERNDDDSCDENGDSFDGDNSHCSDLLYKAKNGTKYQKEKYRE